MDYRDKNICFFSGNIARSGGTERVASIIANELCSRGYNIFFLSYEDGKKSYYKLDERIKIYTLVEKRSKGFFSRKITPYIYLYRFIKRKKIDIIIDIDIILSLYTIPLKKIIKFKNISWEHFNFLSKTVKNRDRARKLAAKFSDCIITLNKTDLENYKTKIKKIRKIDYIYNPAIITSRRVCNTKCKNIIAVGRLTEQKGFDILVDIWKEIEKKDNEWKLQIIGDGSQKSYISNMIKENNLQRIELIPFQENIEEFYEKSSIYVLTSRYEGFPMVLLEAQKKGLPIVAYDCPTGPSEIVINGRNGFLIKFDEKKLFCEKLLALMRNDNLLTDFSKNAIEDSNRFNLQDIVDKWEKIIEEVLECDKKQKRL